MKVWQGLSLVASASLSSCAAGSAAPPRYAPVPAGATLPQSPAGTFAPRILAAHNRERAAARQLAMRWDPTLAASALVYARYLATTGTFRHSDRRARAGTGENLWMGSAGAFSPERMVGNWASEKRWFSPGVFPGVSRTGRWPDVAHYTQIIWPTTTMLGCGVASGRGRDVLVCRYAPAGNIDGRRVP